MPTLLLRLAGPLQSWGTHSFFPRVRDTGSEPSKSGVLGLVCAALGRYREELVDDLAALQLGVRCDQEGSLVIDYHTVSNVLCANGTIKDTEVTRRYYLADAKFLVGLSGDAGLLRQIQGALRRPRWPLCLGRKACVPGEPIVLPGNFTELPLLEALARYPWLGAVAWQRPAMLRLVVDDPAGLEQRRDLPYGAAYRDRTFATRRVTTRYINTPPFVAQEGFYGALFDPFAAESAPAEHAAAV